MIPSRNNFVIANMVCNDHYEIVPTDNENSLKIVSKSHSEPNSQEFLFKYSIFRNISKNPENNKEDILDESTQNIITAISKLDCNFSAENDETAMNSVLAFCNKYGLLKSSAYVGYLHEYGYSVKNTTEEYVYYQADSMDLNEFIFITAKVRALADAYSIYQKIQRQDPAYRYTDIDVLHALRTLLTLLIPNCKALNFLDHEILMERLLDIDYLEDFFYRRYDGNYLRFFDEKIWPLFMKKADYKSYLQPYHAESNTADRLHQFFESNQCIRCITRKFKFGCDSSFSLVYPEKLSKSKTKTDSKKDAENGAKNNKLSRKHQERLYYEMLCNSFPKEQIKPLVELLEHTALCVLNYELQTIHTYAYFEPVEGAAFHMAYQCKSLYEQLIVEIAGMYINKTILTKCRRHDCQALFRPGHHSDKVYCCTKCKNIVAKRKYMYNRRRRTTNEADELE